MLLQRGKKIIISGKAIPGNTVSLSINKQNKGSLAAKDSSWSITLDPLTASSHPSDIAVVSGKLKLIVKDVLVGDVWLCIGQSNMEWPMSQEAHYNEELKHLPNPNLRFYDPVYAGQGIFAKAFSDSILRSLNRENFYRGSWATCDTSSIKDMSAVGYYFGKTITTEAGVPVGLINLAIGGAPIETFISSAALAKYFPEKMKRPWLENSSLPVWIRQRGRENVPGASPDADHAFKPGFAFAAGIEPLARFPIKGIIWYQGESNAQELDRVMEYADLQQLMVRNLRNNWRDTTIRFYYVQLSSIDSVKYRSQLWPQFRDEQRKMMEQIPHSGMAVTSDQGALHDVHPWNKKIVGGRLARWALVKDYGKSLVPSGPLPVRAVWDDSVVRVYFIYAEDLAPQSTLKGFSVDGLAVRAEVDGCTVIVHLPNGAKPVALQYGWKPFSDGNLVNGAGLPASTFNIPVEQYPALIPMPRRLRWTGELYPTSKTPTSKVDGPIRIRIDSSIENPEYYHLKVTADSILVWAASQKGVFYAIQTIEQLKKGEEIQGCEIEDWPAFPWRGYMVDVGRNFMSVKLLKEQIDMMAKYKLNIFHFHLTEDIAWRVEIPGFPQLTKAETMIRNKGSYYSVRDIKDLINYSKERNITMVLEIDMPGHSAAFERAMGVKMQSAEGKKIMKKILESFCNTYYLEYMHIGGDEVKITDSSFLPEMVRYLQDRGKKIIGWDPGGNYGDQVIRQLWMRDAPKSNKAQYIDSRHLYLNHMDPLESVVTIFHRKIGDAHSAASNLRGGTICLWHDRNVRNEQDLMIMNPVYPAMLAFAERSWRGGGESGWITNTTDPVAFGEFEERLLRHKRDNFVSMPFPYWKQADIKWKLYGPYPNGGDLAKNFLPDTTLLGHTPVLTATGGTVILRHFWDPLVTGVLPTSKTPTLEVDNTWYAATQFWSDADTTARFRIGFNNFSRSYTTDSPQEGTWNNLQSKIYINDEEIAPPKWKQAGVKANLELPLIDEGYEYREPHQVKLKKGWNRVVVKLPVGKFSSTNFGNPVKWMFTVIKED
jgi:hypothetical protein